MNTLSTRGRGKQKIVKTTRRKALSARRKRKIDDDKGTTTTSETKKKNRGCLGRGLGASNYRAQMCVCIHTPTIRHPIHTHTFKKPREDSLDGEAGLRADGGGRGAVYLATNGCRCHYAGKTLKTFRLVCHCKSMHTRYIEGHYVEGNSCIK